jgi:hypothetical protein
VPGTQENPAKNCKAILDSGYGTGNGSYWIQVDGNPEQGQLLECDMVTDGGGWTRVVNWLPSGGNAISSLVAEFSAPIKQDNMTVSDEITAVKWCDTNGSGDVISYDASFLVDNSGEIRISYDFEGKNLGGSGFWFQGGDFLNQFTNIRCNDCIGPCGYNRASLYGTNDASFIPTGDGCSTAGDVTEKGSATKKLSGKAVKIRILFSHHNGNCSDYSKLSEFIGWIR